MDVRNARRSIRALAYVLSRVCTRITKLKTFSKMHEMVINCPRGSYRLRRGNEDSLTHLRTRDGRKADSGRPMIRRSDSRARYVVNISSCHVQKLCGHAFTSTIAVPFTRGTVKRVTCSWPSLDGHNYLWATNWKTEKNQGRGDSLATRFSISRLKTEKTQSEKIFLSLQCNLYYLLGGILKQFL